jgi:hypothetical protein
MKLTSNEDRYVKEIFWKEEEPDIKNKYIKHKIKNKAPNCVQKNIKYAASTHLRVLANLYKIKNEGTNSISYAKKKIIIESEKNSV